MSEYQVTYWRDLPSLVVVREGSEVTKSPLPSRFQEAIDEAAMRLGEVDADAYLAGWRRSEWTQAEGSTAAVAETMVARLEETWTPEAVSSFIETLTPTNSGQA